MYQILLLVALLLEAILCQEQCGVCVCFKNKLEIEADCSRTITNESFYKIRSKIKNDKVTNLTLSQQQIFVVPPNAFSSLKQLKNITMDHCSIQSIFKSSFRGLFQLEVLELRKNDINNLPVGMFNDNKNLKILYFDFNKITRLEDELLKGLINLTRISFFSNSIQYIGDNIFKDNTNLEVISLSRNKLYYLNESMIKHLQYLKTLSIFQNPWNCTCELKPLYEAIKAMSNDHQLSLIGCDKPSYTRNINWASSELSNLFCININIDTIHHPNSNNITLVCNLQGTTAPKYINWFRIEDGKNVIPSKTIASNNQTYSNRITIDKTSRSYLYTCISVLNVSGHIAIEKNITIDKTISFDKNKTINQLPDTESKTEQPVNEDTSWGTVSKVVFYVLLVIFLTTVCIALWYWKRNRRNKNLSETIEMMTRTAEDENIYEEIK